MIILNNFLPRKFYKRKNYLTKYYILDIKLFTEFRSESFSESRNALDGVTMVIPINLLRRIIIQQCNTTGMIL